jgi:lipopolysaccharide biosynthesis regulator YciM
LDYKKNTKVDAVKQVISIEKKVRKLIELYNETNRKLNESLQELETQKEINKEQKMIIHTLKEKNTIQKIVKTTESKEGIADAKLKINELIREIDKCIGLLQA